MKTKAAIQYSRSPFASTPKGSETRLRIIEVAISLFGKEGYARTSTRAIASAAGVNAPALQYYFGGKDGLYLACATYIVSVARSRLDPMIDEVMASSQNETNIDRLILYYCRLQRAYSKLFLNDESASKWSAFMSRDRVGLDGRHAFLSIQREFGNRYADLCAFLIGRITDTPPDHPKTLVRLLTIRAQLEPFQTPAGRPLEAITNRGTRIRARQLAISLIEEQTAAILRACARPSRLPSRRRHPVG